MTENLLNDELNRTYYHFINPQSELILLQNVLRIKNTKSADVLLHNKCGKQATISPPLRFSAVCHLRSLCVKAGYKGVRNLLPRVEMCCRQHSKRLHLV